MTTIGMRHDAGMTTERTSVARKAMLASGLAASALYPMIDLAGGLTYPGYSFYSQTISELGAIGAPKRAWLALLFLGYSALMFIFAGAVAMYGARMSSRIRKSGFLLLLYMIVGSGTAFFPVHVRGTAVLADEMPHLLSGLAATLVMLTTIAVSSTSFGRRFRAFSWTMFASIVVFSGLMIPFVGKVSIGEPTPGMGLLERLFYYSMLAWVGVFSVAVARRVDMSSPGTSFRRSSF